MTSDAAALAILSVLVRDHFAAPTGYIFLSLRMCDVASDLSTPQFVNIFPRVPRLFSCRVCRLLQLYYVSIVV